METNQTAQVQLVTHGVQPPPPPSFEKPEIIKALVTHIEDGLLWADSPAEESAADIANHWCNGIDGYDLAKKLENHCGWTPTADDVEQLDIIGSILGSARDKARKNWAQTWRIQPPYPKGTKVKSPKATGVIDGVCDYLGATYLIKEDGCTRDGRHLLVKFEDVTPA